MIVERHRPVIPAEQGVNRHGREISVSGRQSQRSGEFVCRVDFERGNFGVGESLQPLEIGLAEQQTVDHESAVIVDLFCVHDRVAVVEHGCRGGERDRVAGRDLSVDDLADLGAECCVRGLGVFEAECSHDGVEVGNIDTLDDLTGEFRPAAERAHLGRLRIELDRAGAGEIVEFFQLFAGLSGVLDQFGIGHRHALSRERSGIEQVDQTATLFHELDERAEFRFRVESNVASGGAFVEVEGAFVAGGDLLEVVSHVAEIRFGRRLFAHLRAERRDRPFQIVEIVVKRGESGINVRSGDGVHAGFLSGIFGAIADS